MEGTSDEGGRSPGRQGLDAVVRQVWSPAAEPGTPAPVVVTTGGRPAGGGYHEVERYAVLPDARHPRYLVPLGSPTAAAALLRAGRGLRPAAVQLGREVLARAMRARLRPGGRLVVWLRDDASPEGVLPLAHLRRTLGLPDLHMSVGVRPPDPHHKPSLLLASSAGELVGYAKLGHNAATSRLVRTEAEALRSLPVADGRPWRTPTCLHSGSFRGGQSLLVASPLPVLSQYPEARGAPGRETDDVARPSRAAPLPDSAWWSQCGHRIGTAAEEPALTELVSACREYRGRLLERWGAEELELGRWHGDWVPWNMGVDDDGLFVWDWEHSSHDAPVGLDLAHWTFQSAFVSRGESLESAVAAVSRAAEEGTRATAAQRRGAADAYLLELGVRVLDLAREGVGVPGRHRGIVALLRAGLPGAGGVRRP